MKRKKTVMFRFAVFTCLFVSLAALITACAAAETSAAHDVNQQQAIPAVSEGESVIEETMKEGTPITETTLAAPTPQLQKNAVTPVNSQGKRIVGYFTSWSAYARNVTITDIDPSLLTHINFAFANLTPEGEITVGDSWVDLEKGFNGMTNGGHFAQLALLKKENPHIQTLISVGGWTWSGNFSAVAANPQGRRKFAASAVDFVTKYGFDGVDIDWEFPVEGGNGIPHLPQDKENYTLLVEETRKALDAQGQKDGRHYLLTIAAGPNPSFVQNTELAKMSQYLDFINIMAYDYHGAWEQVTGHNAPLYSQNGGLSVSNTVETILAAGVQAEKCNLGLAFYGRGWTGVADGGVQGYGQSGTAPSGAGYGSGTFEGAAFDYWDIAQNYIGKNGYARCFDQDAKTPYLYNGSVWISYDDGESIKAKLDYAASKGLGGVMFWEFSGDKEKTLQKVIAEALGLSAAARPDAGGTSGNEVIKVEAASGGAADKPPAAAAPSAPVWTPDAVYQAGDLAEYNGSLYKAKWWTQNEPPEPLAEWGPWEKAAGS